MTWFKVDDSFYDHPKVFDASDAAVALWTRAGSWAARNLTDGFVPSGLLARLSSDGESVAKELCDRGLWRRARGGFQFHDWADYQPTKERVMLDRKAAAQRQSAYRERKNKDRPDHETSRRYSPRDSRVSNSTTNGVSNTTPTRPDPPPTGERVGGGLATRKPCPQHRGQSADNCAPCRSERVAASQSEGA